MGLRRKLKERALKKLQLDTLPADLYPGFAEQREMLKQQLDRLGFDAADAWRNLVPAATKHQDIYLKRGRKLQVAVARKLMKKLLKAS